MSGKLKFQRDKVEKLIDITSFNEEQKGNLKAFLEEMDYYNKPAAIKYHHNYIGGLAEHSLEVYEELKRQWKAHPKMGVTIHSVIVVSLLHDLCKTVDYVIGEDGEISYNPNGFETKGHASRSISMLEDIIPLSDLEKNAILYHMGHWTSKYEKDCDFNKAIRGEEGLFIYLSHVADMISSIGGC